MGLPSHFYSDGYRYAHLAKTLAETGRLYVYNDISSIDTPFGLSLGSGGRVFIKYEPGLSFLGVPFYLVFGGFGLYIMNALLGFLCCLLIYRTCRLYVSDDAAAHTTLIFGLGTTIFTYSVVFFSEILSAALVLGAFYLLLKNPDERRGIYLIGSGMLAGLLPLTKPTLAIMSLIFLLWELQRGGLKSCLIFSVGMASTVWIFFAYNLLCFGSIMDTGYGSVISGVGGRLEVSDLTSTIFRQGNLLMTVPRMVLVLIITQPVLAVSAMGLAKNKNKESTLIIAFLVALHLVYGMTSDPLGLWCWGSRYLVPVVGLLAVPFAVAYDREYVPPNVVLVLSYVSFILTLFSLTPFSWEVFTKLPFLKPIS